MKFILSALALVLLVSVASAGFLHGGWSAPVYRRVIYSSPVYHGGWSGGYGHGYGGGYGHGYSSYGGSGWGHGWW
ncbi:hypothetical protein ABMA27_003568 [Loxostege sticticalis]|uniref:Uncharacterized protein n=1 Tax=Loxostege sticticalis TaxID=481309 RepID=A0ABR3HPH6_LOXSC